MKHPYAHKKIPLDGREILNNFLIFLRNKIRQEAERDVLKNFQRDARLVVGVMANVEILGF